MEKAIMKAVKVIRNFILFSASVLIFSAMAQAQTENQPTSTEKKEQTETKSDSTTTSEKALKTEIAAEKKAEPQSTPPEIKTDDKNTVQSEEAAAILPYYNNY